MSGFAVLIGPGYLIIIKGGFERMNGIQFFIAFFQFCHGGQQIVARYFYSKYPILIDPSIQEPKCPGRFSVKRIAYEIKYKEAITAIEELKKKLVSEKEASDLFGRQRDEGLKSLLQSIIQTFDGKYLYPTIREPKAFK